MQTGDKTDVRELIDRIRRALATRTPLTEQGLATDLGVYSQLCLEANQRLRDCLNLIKKGQYSNAVALADQEPTLLDLCSDLDLPEREVLPTVASALQIPIPEPINMSLVEAVQEAYLKGNSAESNRRLLHKLTLARAPLPARLAVMRRLLMQDTSHPYMEGDIRRFETAWFAQAVDYCRPFAKEGDAEMLEMVIDDLRNSGYVETPPKAVFSGLENLLSKARQQELPALAVRIQQAYQVQSLAQLKSLFAQWNSLATKAGISPDEPKYGLAEAASWLRKELDDEQKRMEEEQARALLRRSLQQHDIKQSDLENAYAIAVAQGVIDNQLRSQFESRLTELGQRRRNLRLLIGGSSLVLITSLVAGSFWFTQSWRHQREVSRLLSDLTSLSENESYDEIIARSNAAPRSVTSDQKIASLVSSAHNAKTRQVSFENAVKAVADCHPNDDVEPLVTEARKLAIKDTEKRRVDREYDGWRTRKNAQVQIRQGEFGKNIADLVQSIDKLQQGKPWNGATSAAEVKVLEQQLAPLRAFAKSNGMSEAALPNAEKKMGQLQSLIAMSKLMADFLSRQKESTVDDPPLSEIAAFLSETLVRECRDDSLTARLKSASIDQNTWKRVQALRVQLADQSAESLLASVRAWEGTPLSTIVNVCAREAELAESRTFRRSDSKRSANESQLLLERLTASDMKEVTCVRTTGFSYPYYTHSPATAEGDPIEIKYLIDSKGTTLPLKVVGQRKVFPAPQSVFLAKIEPLFAESNQARWHASILAAYSQLLDDTEIDPLLKLQLVDRFLAAMTSSSTALSEVLESQSGFKAVFKKSRTVTGVWYRPEEEDKLEASREEATRLCSSAPKLNEDLVQSVANRDAQLSTIRQQAVHVIGLLAPDADAPQVLLFKGAVLERDGTLYVFAAGKWVELGSVTAGTISLGSEAANHIGWPVIHIRKA